MKAGDIIAMTFGTRTLRVRVLLTEEPPRKEPAPMYEELGGADDGGAPSA